MFTRTFSAVATLALVLSACGEEPKKADTSGTKLTLDDPLLQAEAEADKMRGSVDDDGKLVCAVSGATVLSRVCEIERSETDKGLLLTVRHPDGGFRRLLVVKDGRGVIAADGAEEAVVTPIGPKEIEVALAGNRYRIPATVKGAAPKG